MAKSIYERCFGWLVDRMDSMLEPTERVTANHTVGILDIFGFENMAINGFEQLCINLANERLQLYFNHNIFDMELRDYEHEGIDPINVLFASNVDVLDLLLRRPLGVLALLDEESRFPASTDDTLVAKLDTQLSDDPNYVSPGASDAFGVRHYAGVAVYTASGFLERNRDPLPASVVDALRQSSNSLVSTLFGVSTGLSPSARPLSPLETGRKRPRTSKGSNRVSVAIEATSAVVASWHGEQSDTVSGQFRRSLHEMVQRMERCGPQFIRCLRPNTRQESSAFEADCVLRQLRDTGVLETTRIRKEGYSHRIPLPGFVARYHGLAYPHGAVPAPTDAVCRTILTRAAAALGDVAVAGRQPALEGWQVGHSKVFLKFWHPDALGLLLDTHIRSACKLQAVMRGALARTRVRELLRDVRARRVEAATFMSELHTRSYKGYAALEHLADQDRHRHAAETAAAAAAAAQQAAQQTAAVSQQDDTAPNNTARTTEANAGDPASSSTHGGHIYLAPVGFNNRYSRSRRGRNTNTGSGHGNDSANVKKHAADHVRSMRKHERSVAAWWLKNERPKGCHCDADGTLWSWFHGLLDRSQADDLLEEMPSGSFLVRVCNAFHGYALSYRDQERVRHHRICSTPEGLYQAQGLSEVFETLDDLVDYYCSVSLETHGTKLMAHVKCTHAYNLGNLDTDLVLHSNADPVGRAGVAARQQRHEDQLRAVSKGCGGGGGRKQGGRGKRETSLLGLQCSFSGLCFCFSRPPFSFFCPLFFSSISFPSYLSFRCVSPGGRPVPGAHRLDCLSRTHG